MLLSEHWPIAWGRFQLSLDFNDKNIIAVVVTVEATGQEAATQLPTITPNPSPGVAANINIGSPPARDEVEHIVRLFQGLLGFFCHLEIDFDHPKIDWIGETDEERSRLQLFSYSVQTNKPDPFLPRRLGFDLVVRCALGTHESERLEIPLSFVRKADRDLRADRYIEAFYSLFFFLETLFAPGYSNPNRVKEKMLKAPEVFGAITYAKQVAVPQRGRPSQETLKLLNMPEKDVINHFVDLRGTLHHHALQRAWHPDKQRRYRDEIWFLRDVVQKIAMDMINPILFSDRHDADAMKSAEDSGAILEFLVDAVGIRDGRAHELPSLPVRLAGQKTSYDKISGIEREFRARVSATFPGVDIVQYRIVSKDRDRVFAEYKRAQG